jgi:dipeptidyl aminopeptidase/acylaminoacyl peptidase
MSGSRSSAIFAGVVRTVVLVGLAMLLLGGAAADGAAATVPTDRDPVFSPGGKAIAFVRWAGDGSGRVMLMRRDGRDLHALTPPGPEPYGLTWSPDGKAIAYTADGDIWRVDLATGVPVNLTNDPTHLSSMPAWSPDGSWIAYDRFEGCWRCTAVHLVSPDGTRTAPGSLGYPLARRPTWSPDASELAFSNAPQTVVRLDGTTVATTTVGAYVSFSPDGAQIVYTGNGLHILDLATGANRVVSNAIREFPQWSRDGQTIAGTGFRGRLVLVRPDGRLVATIKGAQTLNDAASWGADGRVAFVHAGRCGIDIAHADGTHIHRLTNVC